MDIPQFDHLPPIKLIACDLDGTLLNEFHAIHDEFWPLVHQLHARGITFCPASGRQYYNLLECFKPIADELIFIAENGAYVMQGARELSSDCLPVVAAREFAAVTRRLQAAGALVGAVLCGKRSAYIEWNHPAFVAEVGKYYQRLGRVEDLMTVEDEILKVAVYAFDSSEREAAPAFMPFRDRFQVVVSGQHWLDVMSPSANKGSGIRHIQQSLGIRREETMVFGDFLNDLEMMDEAAYSFAMANAHPELKARARYLAPSNADNGVVRTIKSLLQLD